MKTMRTIVLGEYESKGNRFADCSPFTIAFVYTPDDSFVVKGMFDQVRKHLEWLNDPYVANITLWHQGESRGYWNSNVKIYIQEPFSHEKTGHYKYRILIYTNRGALVKTLHLRRVPRQWIPDYNLALPIL